MTYGYMGKILRVNLGNEENSFEEMDETFYRRYFGGRGLIAYFLLRELSQGIDPLSPLNKLIFACGPLTGAPIDGSGRNSIGAKSPLTGAYGEAEVGGFWGAEFKRTGLDAMIIEGKAERPVYIFVKDDDVKIKDATKLWGMETGRCQEAILKELDDKSVRVAQIGPGGERLVRYASIVNDLNHTAGRSGMGAVMGSKNLKAIAVRGTKTIRIANPEVLHGLAQWMLHNANELVPNLRNYGSGASMDVLEATGGLPVHNFRDGLFPNVDLISAQAIKKQVRVGMGTCFACTIACKKRVKIGDPWNVDPVYGGPEYETLAALGSNCGVDDLKAICKANELCQKYSLDTISTGLTISFAMECFEKGLLSSKDTDGIELRFGNAEGMVSMVKMIGERKGIGDLLAEGTKRAAQQISSKAEEFALHIKGQEVPLHEPRLKKGLGLGYAISPTGAEHVQNLHDTAYFPKMPTQYEGLGILEAVPVEDMGPKKVRLFTYIVTWLSLDNCLVMCQFPPWTVQQKVDIVTAVTGWNVSAFELMKVSERAINLTRVFNIREGLSDKDDWIPSRFLKPQESGSSLEGISAEKLLEAKAMYYGMMGWDKKGIPTLAKLEELEVSWATAGTSI